MNPAPTNLFLTRWLNVILITLFGLLLWLPTFDTFFQIDRTPTINEKRVLAQFPHLKSFPGGLKEYIAGLEACFNDHFGCRNRLIRWHIDWQLIYLRATGESGPIVIIGRDNWLFYAQNQMVEHYRGVRQFTTQNLRDWQALLEHRRDWLAQRGIKYVFVVAPDKHSIYPEYLPAGMTKVHPETKLDQFFTYMHAHSTVAVVDLRPALLNARRIAPTYLKTDTHWNAFGGFVACQEIAKKLPGLEPLSLASFALIGGAVHVPARLDSARRRTRLPDKDARSSSTAPGGYAASWPPTRGAARLLQRRHDRGVQPLEGRGPALGDAGGAEPRAAQPLSAPPAAPRDRRVRSDEAARVKVLLLGAGGLGSPASISSPPPGWGRWECSTWTSSTRPTFSARSCTTSSVSANVRSTRRKKLTGLNPDVNVVAYDVRLGPTM